MMHNRDWIFSYLSLQDIGAHVVISRYYGGVFYKTGDDIWMRHHYNPLDTYSVTNILMVAEGASLPWSVL